MKTNKTLFFLALLSVAFCVNASADTKPLKALLLTGGCCHDYKAQKDILKKGIEARANVIVDQIHTDNSTTKPDLPIYDNPDYAKGYDVIIHDECAADISGLETIKAVLAPHLKGIPGVNLHCSMHSYRQEGFKTPVEKPGMPVSMWFEYLGLQSTAHGAQKPIEIKFSDKQSPITLGMADWTTVNEELYNNMHVFETAHALASGTQEGNQSVVVWTNDYNGTKVFSTTIGHNNTTVSDPRYLDLVTRGLLWATGKLDEKGEIAKGYGPPNP